MMTVDLERVRFKPAELVAAARDVAPSGDVVAQGRRNLAVGEVVSVFLYTSHRLLDADEGRRERAARDALGAAVPSHFGDFARAMVGITDDLAVREGADRLSRDLSAAFDESDEDLRAARVLAIVEREAAEITALRRSGTGWVLEVARRNARWQGHGA